MSIIEKLGITPLNRLNMWAGTSQILMCHSESVKKLEQQRNEMLEALIRNLELNQRGYFMKQKVLKDIIEKADMQHRSWPEIKELL